jgi:hypothetical protein
MQRRSWIESRARRAVERAAVDRWLRRLRIFEGLMWLAGCELWLIEQVKGGCRWFVGLF